MNVAKRLEEAAATSEILISEATHRLVRDAVVAERVSDRVVKGGETSRRFGSSRSCAHAPGRARRFDSPLVGREQQLSALRGAFASVRQDRACHLLTVLGAGRHRQVAARAGVRRRGRRRGDGVRGHCLPYGEGITYWPLAEVVREILGTRGSVRRRSPSSTAIAELLPGEEKAELIAELISEALGLGGHGGGDAARRPPGRFASSSRRSRRRRPLVVVFDDLQWAEPTFIDLVDHVAELTRDAPILLLCMARPELLRHHPDWGGGKLNATSMLLEPLDDDELPAG